MLFTKNLQKMCSTFHQQDAVLCLELIQYFLTDLQIRLKSAIQQEAAKVLRTGQFMHLKNCFKAYQAVNLNAENCTVWKFSNSLPVILPLVLASAPRKADEVGCFRKGLPPIYYLFLGFFKVTEFAQCF